MQQPDSDMNTTHPERRDRSASSTVIELLTRHHLDLMFALATIFWFGAALAIYVIEADRNPNINSLPDALWWSLITMSTVGYGEVVPVTIAGRLVAAGLIMGGIAMLGVIIANIAALVVADDSTEELDLISEQLDEVLERIGTIERSLESAPSPGQESGEQ
jgi:voltage-gated potassium channel